MVEYLIITPNVCFWPLAVIANTAPEFHHDVAGGIRDACKSRNVMRRRVIRRWSCRECHKFCVWGLTCCSRSMYGYQEKDTAEGTAGDSRRAG